MHQYLVNASIQILPVVQDRHPYEWVDEAIAVIQQQPDVRYEVGPFSTTLEGTYDKVMNTIHAVNEHLLKKGCAEWISNIQLQIRSGEHITGNEKTAKYQ